MQAIESHTSVGDNRLAEMERFGSKEPALLHLQPTRSYLFNYVLANNNQAYAIPVSMNLQPVLLTAPSDSSYTVIAADVVDEQHPWRHDTVKLSNELMAWYKQNK